MAIFDKIYLGTVLKGKVYQGSTLIFSSAAPAVPDVPTGLTTSDIQSDSITITWNAVAGADSYDIQFREQGQSWANYNGETGTSKQFTGLQSSTVFEFQVRANNANGSSAYTSTENATTDSVGNPLEILVNFGTDIGGNTVFISKTTVGNKTTTTLKDYNSGAILGNQLQIAHSYYYTSVMNNTRGGSNSDGYDTTLYGSHVYGVSGGAAATFTITGLDAGKTYTIKAVGSFYQSNYTTRLTVGGVQKTNSALSPVTHSWTGLSPDGSGNLALSSHMSFFGAMDRGFNINFIHLIEE